MQLKKFHLYKIEWIDAFSSNSWTDINDVEREVRSSEQKPVTCYGAYIRSDKKFLTFTTGYDYDKETLFNYWSVPKGWIVSIKEIK